MNVWLLTPSGFDEFSDDLKPLIDTLRANLERLTSTKAGELLELLDHFGRNLLEDERTRALEGIPYLSSWLRLSNQKDLMQLNIQGEPAYLDGFVRRGNSYLAARPHGLACMWMAGNVGTLPLYSLVPALLAKNVCLVKLAYPDPDGLDSILAVLSETEATGVSGKDISTCFSLVWFDYRNRALSTEMSIAADIKIAWGGSDAVRGITALPRMEHCPEIVFGPKYSLGIIGRKLMDNAKALETAVAAFVRDINAFDQRACSSPQTIFFERNENHSLKDVGRMFAKHLTALPPKTALDAYTTLSIMNARAEWALRKDRDVLSSEDGANWTVCMDREVSLKEAVQSRTLFLTEVGSWKEIIPLVTHKVQTIGIAFHDPSDALSFSEQATLAGAVRCVRPGLMNAHESPWDGKLLLNELVRWVTIKP